MKLIICKIGITNSVCFSGILEVDRLEKLTKLLQLTLDTERQVVVSRQLSSRQATLNRQAVQQPAQEQPALVDMADLPPPAV